MQSNIIAAAAGLELVLPECERGLGQVIRTPNSPGLIDGVTIRPLDLHPDDRGYFLEILRMGRGLPAEFPPPSTQVSCALSYPGAIKAFHFHRHQTDLWAPVMGMLQVALVDFRKGSPTFGMRNTLYIGSLRPWQLLIPAGGGHGYKVLGSGEAVLVYVTDRFYDPEDEGRVPYDDPRIQYDWETQHK